MDAICSGSRGIFRNVISFFHTAEILLAASGKESASGPGMRMRRPERSSLSTDCAAISPTSRALTVGRAGGPPTRDHHPVSPDHGKEYLHGRRRS